MDEVWQKRVRWIGYLAIPASVGIVLLIGAVIGIAMAGGSTTDGGVVTLFVVGVLLMLPEMIWLNLVPFMHWAKRYRGHHSTLWLCLLVFETSGWFKLIYLFRHILPDWRGKGRYKPAPVLPPIAVAGEAGAGIL
jgi:hypothetical protein